MTQNDEILTRYTLDMKQPFQEVDQLGNALVNLDKTGVKTFSDIGKQAQDAGKSIANSGQLVQRASTQYNSLGNSINQISRELPAFTMNLNTGFLAISNNLPALADAINQIKASNKDLAAQGKQTQSVLGAIGTALVSWQTALSVGITLLTAYGGQMIDFIANGGKAKKSQEELAKEEAEHNKVLQEQLDLINAINVGRNKEQDNLDAMNAARSGGINERRRELEILKAQGASAEDIFNKEQEIRNLELIALKNRNQALELFGDERIKNGQKILDKENEIVAAKYKFEKEQADIAKKEAEKRAKERAELDAKLLQFARENNVDMRQQALDEINVLTDEYLKDKELRKKADDDEQKQKRELLGEDTKRGYQRMEVLRKQAEEEIELQRQIQNAYYESYYAIASIFGSLAQIAGQNTEAGKTFAIIETLISTIVSTQKMFEQASKSPVTIAFPAYPYIVAGAAAAAGAARVAAIRSIETPSVSTSVPSVNRQSSTLPRGFKDGVVDLDGPGTSTSDSIPAYLSRGESVIKASSTRMKRDELSALNRSVLDYEALINKKYIQPVVDDERRKQTEFAENIVRSIMVQSNNKEIVKAINKNRPASARDIVKMTETIARQSRIDNFESKLKQPRK